MSLKAVPIDGPTVRGLVALARALPSADHVQPALTGQNWLSFDADDAPVLAEDMRRSGYAVDLGGGRRLYVCTEPDTQEVTDVLFDFALFWPPFGRDHDAPAEHDGAEEPHDDYWGPGWQRHPTAPRSEFNATFARTAEAIATELGPPRAGAHNAKYDWTCLMWTHQHSLIAVLQCDDNLTYAEYDRATVWLQPWSPGDPLIPPEGQDGDVAVVPGPATGAPHTGHSAGPRSTADFIRRLRADGAHR